MSTFLGYLTLTNDM